MSAAAAVAKPRSDTRGSEPQAPALADSPAASTTLQSRHAERQPHVLLVDAPDRPGLIHQITGVLLRQAVNVIANHEFVDRESRRFFMRSEFVGACELAEVTRELRQILGASANVRVAAPGRGRIVVLATKEHHCLAELLLRHLHGELGASIAAVISNHPTLAALTHRFGIPFHHVSHEGINRAEHEWAILEALERYQPDYLVLAKYMRILGHDFVQKYVNRIVNIHHSFLPAFVGANPHRQAFERGVKIIGATAHFVTETLDEGPIIAQAVIPVDHSYRASDMARAGQDIEKLVLAQALKLVFEQRVFLTGTRTVIFN